MSNEWLEKKGVPWCFREDSPKLAATGKAFVINLDDKANQGTHWTAARLIGDKLFYADPFGTILNGYPPEELQDMVSPLDIVANSIAWQRPKTNLCGYYAYRFTKAMAKMTEDSTQKELEHAIWQSIK